MCIWCGCKIQEGTWRETVDSPTCAGQEKSRRVWVAHLIFGLEPLVLHRRLGDSVAGEAQVVARHQSHRLGLNDDLQGWNIVEKISFLLHRFDRTTHKEGTAKHRGDIVFFYLKAWGTPGPRSCPEFGGGQWVDLRCNLALPSASAACGSGCPRAAAPSESTPLTHRRCGWVMDNGIKDTSQGRQAAQVQTTRPVWTQNKMWICRSENIIIPCQVLCGSIYNIKKENAFIDTLFMKCTSHTKSDTSNSLSVWWHSYDESNSDLKHWEWSQEQHNHSLHYKVWCVVLLILTTLFHFYIQTIQQISLKIAPLQTTTTTTTEWEVVYWTEFLYFKHV